MHIVKVIKLPVCDICGATARYDLSLRQGPWANVCRPCALDYTYLRQAESQDIKTALGSEFQLG
jgi:hypothetical protein